MYRVGKETIDRLLLKDYGDEEHIRAYLIDTTLTTPPLIDLFLNGFCDVFAAVAYSSLEVWDLMGFTENRNVVLDGKIMTGEGLVHAFCVLPDTEIVFDAKGKRLISDLTNEYELDSGMHLRYFSDQKVLIELYKGPTETEEYLRELQSAIYYFLKKFYL